MGSAYWAVPVGDCLLGSDCWEVPFRKDIYPTEDTYPRLSMPVIQFTLHLTKNISKRIKKIVGNAMDTTYQDLALSQPHQRLSL